MKLKSLISTVALIAGMTAVAPAAQAAEWSLSADYVQSYIFRGNAFGENAIQPGLEVSLDNGLTIGVWGSTGLGDDSEADDDEVDFYGSYGFALSDGLSLDVGATLYHYPQYASVLSIGDDITENNDASTIELFGSLGFDTMFAPAVSMYYDITLESYTLEAGIGHSVAISDALGLDLGATVGTVEDSNEYLNLNASVSTPINEAGSAYLGLTHDMSSEDTIFGDDNKTWFGFGVSSGF